MRRPKRRFALVALSALSPVTVHAVWRVRKGRRYSPAHVQVRA
jgi:hypothetical protein